MQYLCNLVFHFFTSNSRHGTHSPFVYKLADEVIYAEAKNDCKNKGEGLLLDISNYYSIDYSSDVSDASLNKALLVDDVIDIDILAGLQRQFRYIVLRSIYKNRNTNKLWKAVCQDSRFIVCIDLFYFGIVFYRSEQPKELFKLRFPYWR